MQALLSIVGTDWRTTPAAPGGQGLAASVPQSPADTHSGTPSKIGPSARPSKSDTAGTPAEDSELPPPETSASDLTADLAARHGAAEGPVGAAGSVHASPAAAGSPPAESPFQSGHPPGDGRPPAAGASPLYSQVRRSLRRLSLPPAAPAAGEAVRGHRASQTLAAGDGGDACEDEILTEASVDTVVADAGEGGGGAQVGAACTEANQHIVAGALDFVEQSRSTLLPALLRRRPHVARCLLLVMTAALRYDTRVRLRRFPLDFSPGADVGPCVMLAGSPRPHEPACHASGEHAIFQQVFHLSVGRGHRHSSRKHIHRRAGGGVQDVKAMVTSTLPVVVQLLERRVGDAPDTFLNGAMFGDVAALLCGRMRRGRLHWREALITQLLCLHLVPLTNDQARLEELLAAQVHGMFHGTSLLCKVPPTPARPSPSPVPPSPKASQPGTGSAVRGHAVIPLVGPGRIPVYARS